MNQQANGQGTLRELPREPLFLGARNRVLQALARLLPGATSTRVTLHRWRGVRIGKDVHIGNDVILETAYPSWVSIGDRVQIGIRVLIMAHVHGMPPKRQEHENYVSVQIDDDVYIGPGVIILPNVRVGRGAVICAGTVVTRSVSPLTMVQGNPARPVAQCGIPLLWTTPLKEFYRKLKPLARKPEATIPVSD